MADLEAVAWAATGILHYSTLALIVGTLVWAFARLRKTPLELLQLRAFERQSFLFQALLALTIGTIASAMVPAPGILGLPTSAWWSLGWSVLWAVSMWYGFIRLIEIFRDAAPKSARTTRTREASQ